ncbi:hypothetical protein KC19_8G124300 [Ceratodon purpureus]|uniref:Uncharacterized protein n=1 Tax=Ceratodon purpureus TaxID=3225 RepID=A0A8T0GZW0_CERPU|nr:hypothetical protein KC19_8G124300 [Ceratodon purpureus]
MPRAFEKACPSTNFVPYTGPIPQIYGIQCPLSN